VRGFTLVEVVVSLAILSLVLLATVTGLRTLANTQSAIERMIGRVDEIRTVSSFLRDTMESAAVGESSGGGLALGSRSRDAAYFAMAPTGLAWKSTILFGEDFGGSYLIRVAKENELLVLRWQAPDASGQPGDWSVAEERTLVENVEEFEVSWREGYQDSWQQEWEVGDQPSWVRLQVKAGGRYWPELIMEVPH
jgi:general secretion pathway protein J